MYRPKVTAIKVGDVFVPISNDGKYVESVACMRVATDRTLLAAKQAVVVLRNKIEAFAGQEKKDILQLGHASSFIGDDGMMCIIENATSVNDASMNIVFDEMDRRRKNPITYEGQRDNEKFFVLEYLKNNTGPKNIGALLEYNFEYEGEGYSMQLAVRGSAAFATFSRLHTLLGIDHTWWDVESRTFPYPGTGVLRAELMDIRTSPAMTLVLRDEAVGLVQRVIPLKKVKYHIEALRCLPTLKSRPRFMAITHWMLTVLLPKMEKSSIEDLDLVPFYKGTGRQLTTKCLMGAKTTDKPVKVQAPKLKAVINPVVKLVKPEPKVKLVKPAPTVKQEASGLEKGLKDMKSYVAKIKVQEAELKAEFPTKTITAFSEEGFGQIQACLNRAQEVAAVFGVPKGQPMSLSMISQVERETGIDLSWLKDQVAPQNVTKLRAQSA